MKGKALRRALATQAVIRVNADIPAITDETRLIDPAEAKEMLTRNHNNRPVNWRKVEEFAAIMRKGDWKLHPQGIILDPHNNILTGQTRLWAIIYADVAIYMRVSMGSPADTASVIDRGRSQSARDLATRQTERKHSPTEASICRCVCVLAGIPRPSTDDIAAALACNERALRILMKESAGTKKDKALLMVLGAICAESCDDERRRSLVVAARQIADSLEVALTPYTAESCWGRGVSFAMGLRKAAEIVGAWRR